MTNDEYDRMRAALLGNDETFPADEAFRDLKEYPREVLAEFAAAFIRTTSRGSNVPAQTTTDQFPNLRWVLNHVPFARTAYGMQASPDRLVIGVISHTAVMNPGTVYFKGRRVEFKQLDGPPLRSFPDFDYPPVLDPDVNGPVESSMTPKEILHALLKSLDPKHTYGVDNGVWDVIARVTRDVYGDDGIAVLELYHDTTESFSMGDFHTIAGWEDDGVTPVTPVELIGKLETLRGNA